MEGSDRDRSETLRGPRAEPSPDEAYELLRALTSPLVAITVRRGERLNGMVANSAIRASLVPGRLGVAFYVFKRHLTHRILADTGRFVLHILSREQWDEIWALGFRSGWESRKMDDLRHEPTEETGLPVLTRCHTWLECRVANVMDAGPSTFFMGLVVRIGRGTGREIMDSPWFRANMPEEWRPVYEDKLGEAQLAAEVGLEAIDDRPWRELRERVRAESEPGL